MASIRCKACGCTYDYNKEGMCPKCGAYNRPPRRERVDPDGSIHYLEPRDAAVPPHHGKKVCYEKKTCYEEQTRRSRQPADTGEADDHRAQEWENLKGGVQRLWTRYQTMDKKQRGNVGKIIIAVVIGLVLLLNSCNIHRENNVSDEPDWSEGSSVVAVPEPTYADYQMHEWFDTYWAAPLPLRAPSSAMTVSSSRWRVCRRTLLSPACPPTAPMAPYIPPTLWSSPVRMR